MAIFGGDNAVAITPSDTADLGILAKRLYVGSTGAIKVDTASGVTITFAAVPVGVFEPGCKIKKVYSTGTAASSIIGIY